MVALLGRMVLVESIEEMKRDGDWPLTIQKQGVQEVQGPSWEEFEATLAEVDLVGRLAFLRCVFFGT